MWGNKEREELRDRREGSEGIEDKEESVCARERERERYRLG